MSGVKSCHFFKLLFKVKCEKGCLRPSCSFFFLFGHLILFMIRRLGSFIRCV